MPKAAFQALDLSIKRSRPFPSDLKKYYKQGKLLKVISEILKIPTILHILLVSHIYSSQKVDISTTNI